MDRPATVRTVTLDDEGHIAGHTPCRRCGGELRGLSPQGRCVQCGEPIDAVTEDALARAVSDGPRCAGCGRYLRSEEGLDCCPRCGLPVAVSVSKLGRSSASDGAVPLAHDVYCRKCGYNLRGLDRGGLCPECAAPVGLSLRRDFFCYAEAKYVATLARGGRWITRGLSALAVCIVVSLGARLLMAWSYNTESATMYFFSAVLLAPAFLLIIASAVTVLFSIWLMTTAEPNVLRRWRRDFARRLVRISLLAGPAGFALSEWLSGVRPPTSVLSGLSTVVSSVIGVIGTRSYLRYLRDVAERIPDRRIAARAQALARDMTIAVAALAFLHVLDTVVLRGPVFILPTGRPVTATSSPASATVPTVVLPSLNAVRTWATRVAALAVLVHMVRTVGLLCSLRGPLEQQAALAARHWAMAGGTGNNVP